MYNFILRLKEIVRVVFEVITCRLISGSFYFTLGFSISAKTWKYYLRIYLVLHIKLHISFFISFRDIKLWKFPSQSHIRIHTHTYTQTHPHTDINFQKTFFFGLSTTKHEGKLDVENFERIQSFHCETVFEDWI